jgi:hypothetical protein
MKKFSIWAALAFISISLLSTKCTEPEVEPEEDTEEEEVSADRASVTFMVQTEANDETFYLDSAYVTTGEDTIYVSTCKFYISNVMFVDSANADTLVLPNSYHLYDRANGSMNMWHFACLPEGTYDRVLLSIGVDSAANLNSDHTEGDLDPTGDMVWNWSTGYKFLRLEGKHRTNKTGNFSFHIGHAINYQTLELKLGAHGGMGMNSDFSLVNDAQTEVHIMADVMQLFTMPNALDLDITNSQTGSKTVMDEVAENSAHHFLMLHHAGN